MGFELVRIATSANGLKVPDGAKCCLCHLLLEDGVNLSGCVHNACYQCMQKRAHLNPICPKDGKLFNPKTYRYLQYNIEDWLRSIRMKCRWFNGRECTATGIALRNVRRHEEICANHPDNQQDNRLNLNAKRQLVKQVDNWIKKSEFMFKTNPLANRCSASKCDTTRVEEWIRDWSSNNDTDREGGDKSLNNKNKLTAAQTNTVSNGISSGSRSDSSQNN